MRTSLKLGLTLILILQLYPAFPQSQDKNIGSPDFFQKTDSIVQQKMMEYGLTGISIGLVKNEAIIYAKGYGFRDINTKSKVSENSIFHTASISKLFTAEAIMHLVENKKLSLDDKLIDIIPDLNYTDKRIKEITIRQLLNHTSGLPDIQNYHWDNNNQSDESLSKYILGLKLKLRSDPSSKYYYSNLAYDILGYVIENVSGATFDDYLKNEVLNPHGMNESDFRYFEIKDSLKTSPHSIKRVSKLPYVLKTYPYTREHAASSTLNSSSKELSFWMIQFLKQLKDASRNSIQKELIKPSFAENSNIGLGFQLYDFGSYQAVGHFGGDKGFRSFLMMIPDHDLGLVVLGNCDYEEDFRQEILLPIAQLMLQR